MHRCVKAASGQLVVLLKNIWPPNPLSGLARQGKASGPLGTLQGPTCSYRIPKCRTGHCLRISFPLNAYLPASPRGHFISQWGLVALLILTIKGTMIHHPGDPKEIVGLPITRTKGAAACLPGSLDQSWYHRQLWPQWPAPWTISLGWLRYPWSPLVRQG